MQLWKDVLGPEFRVMLNLVLRQEDLIKTEVLNRYKYQVLKRRITMNYFVKPAIDILRLIRRHRK